MCGRGAPDGLRGFKAKNQNLTAEDAGGAEVRRKTNSKGLSSDATIVASRNDFRPQNTPRAFAFPAYFCAPCVLCGEVLVLMATTLRCGPQYSHMIPSA